MAKHVLLTKRPSGNRKTGPVFCIYRTFGITCAPGCPLKKPCYGGTGPTFLAGEKARDQVVDLQERYDKLPQMALVRHDVVGDFFLHGKPDMEFIDEVAAAHESYPDIHGWGYTHGWRLLVPDWFRLPNLTIRASCESDVGVEEALDLGWRTTKVVVPGYKPKKDEVYCAHETRGIPCSCCTLCRKDGRTILFTAHGYRKQSLIRMLS